MSSEKHHVNKEDIERLIKKGDETIKRRDERGDIYVPPPEEPYNPNKHKTDRKPSEETQGENFIDEYSHLGADQAYFKRKRKLSEENNAHRN